MSVVTLGCRLNQGESEQLARDFVARGYRVLPEESPADVYVVNTCTVTHVADRKSRQLIRRARRLNPDGIVVVTGCYPSVAEEEVRSLGLADLVLPNVQKPVLAATADRLLRQRRAFEVMDCTEAATGVVLSATDGPQRARAFLKVQDGCNDRCTYCIIPRARGRSRSLPPDEVVAKVRARLAEGYPEVVLSGITMNMYGHDLEELIDLGGLIRSILAETPVPRLSLSSLEPNRFKPGWLDLWSDPRLSRHLHLALQSGSDAVLRAMKRRYRRHHYREVVAAVRRAIPDCSLTTDVIVGFPGETDQDFRQTCDFVQEQQLSAIHVFPYSPRPGTPAATFPDPVPQLVKAQRVQELIALGERLRRRFQESLVGTTQTVLWEQWRDGVWNGRTGHQVVARTASCLPRQHAFSRVRVEGSTDEGLWVNLLDC